MSLKYLFDTFIPKKIDSDLELAHTMALEKYKTKFPQIAYLSLLLPQQSVPNGGITTDLTKTVIDDLWGEDTFPESSAGFIQPHSNVAVNPTVDKKLASAINANVNIEYEQKRKPLHKFGTDEEHRPLFVFLNWQLKCLGLPGIQLGDQFVWKDAMYEIQTFKLRGRWGQTDWFLYTAAEATLKQLGG